MVTAKLIESKKWYESKTIWINFLIILGVIITGFEGLLSSGEAITLMAVMNLILRAITKARLE